MLENYCCSLMVFKARKSFICIYLEYDVKDISSRKIMNKDLILKLVKVANSLDHMGLTKEANKIDRIAQYYTQYQILINQYKEHILSGRRDEAELLLNNVVSGRGGLKLQEIGPFKKQALRIRNENPISKGNIVDDFDDSVIEEYGNDFGLNMARDKKNFDIKWKQMLLKIHKDWGNNPKINQALKVYYKSYVAWAYNNF